MKSKVVIVYSVAQARRRVLYLPDDDREVPGLLQRIAAFDNRLGVLVGELGEYNRLGPDEMLKRFLGRLPSSDRCMVVQGNTVVAIAHADPALDSIPGHALMPDTMGKAAIGHTVVNGLPVPPFVPPPVH